MMMMMKQQKVALLVAAGLGLAATAKAGLVWDWTVSGSTDNGSGTFTTTDYGDFSGVSAYLVTGASGTFDGIQVNGVPGLTTAQNAGWDQLLFPSDADPAGAPVDNSGLVLTLGNSSTPYAGFFSAGPGGIYGVNTVVSGTLTDINNYGNHFSDLQLSITPAPEPSQVVSMLGLAAIGGVGLLGRLRRRK